MPRYVYRCEQCEEQIQKVHSIKDKLKDCPLCEEKDSLIRMPSSFNTLKKDKKTGTIVKEFIEDAKRDIAFEKKKISGQIYNKQKGEK